MFRKSLIMCNWVSKTFFNKIDLDNGTRTAIKGTVFTEI